MWVISRLDLGKLALYAHGRWTRGIVVLTYAELLRGQIKACARAVPFSLGVVNTYMDSYTRHFAVMRGLV